MNLKNIVLWLFIGFSSVIYAEEKKENASTAPKVAEEATTEEDVPAELARALAAMKKYKQPKLVKQICNSAEQNNE